MRPDGTETGEPPTLGGKWKPEDLVVALTLLIIEGRTPELSPKGRTEGPHCPAGTLLPGSGHTCLPGHQQCERAHALSERARLLWRNAVPVMVELGLRVSCCAGRDDPPSGPEGSDSELGRGALLLERWALRSIPKRAGDALVGDKALIQSIRSYVHFSQLSAWLSAVQGNLSYTIFYRVCAPGESLVSDFEHSPVEHSFPTTASTPGCTLRISVSALPYLPGLPTIYCSVHASLHLDTSGPTCNASPGPSSPATSTSLSSSDVRTQVSFETGTIDAQQNLRVPGKVVVEYIRPSPHLLNCEYSSPADHPRDYSEENGVWTREMPDEQQPRCHMPGRRPSGRTLKLTLGTNPDRSTSHTSPLASLLQGREVIASIAERLALCDLESSHLTDSHPPLTFADKLSALSELKQTVKDPFGAVCRTQHNEVQSKADKSTLRVADLSSCCGHETPLGFGSVFSRHRPTKLRVKRKLLPSPVKAKVTEEKDQLDNSVFDGDEEEEEEEASPDDDDPCHSPPAKCSVPPALGRRLDGSQALRGTKKLTRVGLRQVPERRSKKGCFDVDTSLLQNNGHIKTKFLSREAWKERDGTLSSASSHPVSSHNLLGTFEESVLNLRLPVMGTVGGFLAQLGASGAFCPNHVSLPVHVYFFHIADDGSPSPYLGILSLRPLGYRGYHVPRAGTIQVTLFNPNKTVVKMFVVMYNLRDMPPNHQTFLRQRTFSVPVARQTCMGLVGTERALPPTKTGLRYLVHLRFVSSKSGKIYLHRDIRLLFSRKSTEIDSGVAYELKSYTEMPQNPRFSPRG
uniref:Family with sequence similarity 214 member A n=1 Tax=Eptatretus burgeri TaxID=7764 RepID=A0A8C4QRH4_EPTBU